MTELTQLMGCRHEYNGVFGGWAPVHDEKLETSMKGVYVAGDLTGIEEASVAMEEGRVAGISAAESLGKIGGTKADSMRAEAKKRLDQLRSGSFGRHGKEKGLTPAKGCGKCEAGCEERDVQVIIECYQDIPCNPCEKACPSGAITVGSEITNLPKVDASKCTGCASCVAACPGLAIFLVDRRKSGAEMADVTFPYEYLPAPVKDSEVEVVDRDGKVLGKGKVVRVATTTKYDRTSLVTVRVEKGIALRVRGIVKK